MRILRSQYLKYQTRQGMHSMARQTTSATTTSSFSVSGDEMCVRQTRSQTIKMRLAASQAHSEPPDKNNNNESSNDKRFRIRKSNRSEVKNVNHNKAIENENIDVNSTNFSVSLANESLYTFEQATFDDVNDVAQHVLLLTPENLTATASTSTSTICCTIRPDVYAEEDSNYSTISAENSTSSTNILKRRQTVDCSQQLKIKLYNVPTDLYSSINLVVRFYDEGQVWYSRFYMGYQDILWMKLPRYEKPLHKRWHYECRVCKRLLCSFVTLIYHLNIHMRFYPFECVSCDKSYAGKQTLRWHERNKHGRKAKSRK